MKTKFICDVFEDLDAHSFYVEMQTAPQVFYIEKEIEIITKQEKKKKEKRNERKADKVLCVWLDVYKMLLWLFVGCVRMYFIHSFIRGIKGFCLKELSKILLTFRILR